MADTGSTEKATEGYYQADDSSVWAINLAKTMLAGQTVAAPTKTVPTIKVHKNRRTVGIHPRYVMISRERGTGDDTFTESRRYYVMTKTKFDSMKKGDTVQLDGKAFKLTGVKVGELIR